MKPLGGLDFETHAILPRPAYPPEPVGVALHPHGRQRGDYWRWGHPSGNNCTKAEAVRRVRDFLRHHTPVMHNAKFDLDVLETKLGLPWPSAWHDTLLLAFLLDPDSDSLSLKPLSVRYLGLDPKEQDELHAWILVRAAEGDPLFKGATQKTAGAYIARCPGELVAPYAIGDTSRTLKLFAKFMKEVQGTPLEGAYARELKVTRTLVKMERRGAPVDVRRLREDVPKFEATKRAVEDKLLRRLKVPVRERRAVLHEYEEQDYFKWSGKGFAERLVSSGLVEALPKTEKGNPSTSAESLAQVMPARLAKEFEVRSQLQTCLATFMRPWLQMAQDTGGRFYASYNQVRNGDEWGKKTGARTGRLSMTPNLQNVIRSDKDPRVPLLRDYIVALKGGHIAKRDYSQQELRLLAEFENGPFKEAYLKDPERDGHLLVRDLILATTGLELDRRPTKDLNFGLIYGQGLTLTAEKMGVAREVAQRLRKAHGQSLPGVPVLQRRIKERIDAGEPIWTWGGRRYYNEKPIFAKGRWFDFDYKMLNKLIQGSAADVTKQAMVNYDALGDFAEENPLILQVHDELVNLLARLTKPAYFHQVLAARMADMPGLEVPMLSDGGTSKFSWHRMEKCK